jgi:hypothetical protein
MKTGHLRRWRCAPRCGVLEVRLAPVLAPPSIWPVFIALIYLTFSKWLVVVGLGAQPGGV